MTVISVDHLTKDYGHGRGVFDVSIQVDKGECYGFLGPNGAGKTTTIRHLMGFSKPEKGSTAISGMDSWKNSATLKNTVGYLPGEVTLPAGLSGTGFLRMMGQMRHVENDSYLKMLLEKFDLDPNVSIKRMSLGVKRKLAVVTAFMQDPDILILDEPTSGLDPVMQETFIEFVKEEKERGKTIFLSSHIFHEVDATCDRIAIIRDGKIVSEFKSEELKQKHDRIYRVTFADEISYMNFVQKPFRFTSKNKGKLRARVQMEADRVGELMTCLCDYNVADFIEIPFTLEDYFMGFYDTGHHFQGVSA
ncbi:MAG: ABC transporter ATP-binding protein [Lachnospiraceae bacterium]|nr:ABC transporter ATP-binding protein [Clostridiales bacterium]MCD7715525.1 ABC transporter ATP-binding protein [Lachnospiraceae bacterium]